MNKLKTFLADKVSKKIFDTVKSYEEELLEKVDLPDALESALGVNQSDDDEEATKENAKTIPLEEDDFLSEEKRVDFVLVALKGSGGEEEEEIEKKRRRFEKNLHDNGLLLQHVQPTMPNEVGETYIFNKSKYFK